ncbi:MAG: alkaline phosphatase family protein [Thermogemmatispora sp.]|jgi:phospholipase C|uniref:Phospholipase C n=1 Tax=Thermogemmatispora aurantia TaxID=2045279 RepID=A0A5J4KB18_9CHLR|nr:MULTISPECIES: alkaline phosphatase family protein [Thermogemmatispora]MBE3567230.1 alkaline phosphatase family protein [Thermogemmatispora sp.]GER84695.1 phospholipase C [Thermogemmatispora aurantia]
MKRVFQVGLAVLLMVILLGTVAAASAPAQLRTGATAARRSTVTPIQHLVVIFDENVSFDHYFATYPVALNPPGEPAFHARPGTPTVNGLTPSLLNHNPNLANPKRLDRSQALTCDQDHGYTDEQKAFDHGLMDSFVQSVAGSSCTDKSIVLDYYDGNTVTALWNYAQHFAMSDNSFGTTFGPSTPGALNLVSGQTHGATPANVPGLISNGTVISDVRPAFDDCSVGTTASLSGKNIGDLLNAKGITWGWFQGGFRPTAVSNGKAVCGAAHKNIGGATVTDYIPHHEPFQYYQSTANPHHLPPSSVHMIGRTDQANHQYDLSDFWAALQAGNLPAVSFLKPPAYQDGHAGYSDPLDEQQFLVNTINRLERSEYWGSMAIIIAYDDSDGWYDHVMGPIVNHSADSTYDALTGPGQCGTPQPGAYSGRCGYGPRLPLLVISPFARVNFVDHTVTDQTSILRFIEDNWQLGRIGDQSFDELAGPLTQMFDFSAPRAARLFLDPESGTPL